MMKMFYVYIDFNRIDFLINKFLMYIFKLFYYLYLNNKDNLLQYNKEKNKYNINPTQIYLLCSQIFFCNTFSFI